MYDQTIVEHSATSQRHHEEVMRGLAELKQLELKEGDKMNLQETLDKISINMGGGGASNTDFASLLALANQNRGNDGGMNQIWPILLLALMRGGLGFGAQEQVCTATGTSQIELTAILSKLGTLEAGQALGVSQIQTFLATQTGEISNQLNQMSLGVQQGFNNIERSIANSAATGIAAGNANTAQILAAVQGVKDQQTNFRVADLEQRLTVAESRGLEDRLAARFELNSRNVEQNVRIDMDQRQNNTQVQASLNGLLSMCNALMVQNNRNTQDIVNLGTMTASGTQASANTQVR